MPWRGFPPDLSAASTDSPFIDWLRAFDVVSGRVVYQVPGAQGPFSPGEEGALRSGPLPYVARRCMELEADGAGASVS